MTCICLPTLSYHIKCCNCSLESFYPSVTKILCPGRLGWFLGLTVYTLQVILVMLMLVLDVESAETRTTETAPRTYSLLRPSAFSLPAAASTAGIIIIINDIFIAQICKFRKCATGS